MIFGIGSKAFYILSCVLELNLESLNNRETTSSQREVESTLLVSVVWWGGIELELELLAEEGEEEALKLVLLICLACSISSINLSSFSTCSLIAASSLISSLSNSLTIASWIPWDDEMESNPLSASFLLLSTSFCKWFELDRFLGKQVFDNWGSILEWKTFDAIKAPCWW